MARRLFWNTEIVKISGHFGSDSSRVEQELTDEWESNGQRALLDHLRLCSAIPESFIHDSSEEKLYSKYTDALLAIAFRAIGMKSYVLVERADTADVEVVCDNYSFVADAKVFRLSRTAKNQKDFKIQAMDGWKRGKPYALVVCPLYQLPVRASQIYQQAAAHNVCILSYSHVSVLLMYAELTDNKNAQQLLESVMQSVEAMLPSKDSLMYWRTINQTFLAFDPRIADLWKTEKIANSEAITILKNEALTYLASLREATLRLSHDEALQRLLAFQRLDSRAHTISAINDNGLLTFT